MTGSLYPQVQLETAEDSLRIVAVANGTRFVWGSTTLVFVVLLLATAWFGIKLIRSRLRHALARPWLVLVLVLPALAAGAAWINRLQNEYGVARAFLAPVYARLDSLESRVFATGRSPVSDPLAVDERAQERARVRTVTQWTSVTRFIDGLAIGTIVLVILGFGTSLHNLDEPPLEELARRSQSAAQLLYLSGALLATGVLELFTLLRWPVPYLAHDQASSAAYFDTMARGMTLAVGVFFTTMLFSVAVPVFTTINDAARAKIAQRTEHLPESALNESLKQYGFEQGVWKRAANAAAVLGPALAAVLGPPVAALFTQVLQTVS